MQRRQFLLASAAMMLSYGGPTWGQTFSRTGQIYFGFGKTGIGSRLGLKIVELITRVAPDLKYEFVNEPGDNTLKASMLVKESLPTENKLLQVTGTLMSLYPCLYNSLPYDPIQDFVPVSIYGENAFALVVGPLVDSAVNTVDDYVAWVRENPEFRNFGAVLYGSESHLAGLALARSKRIALRPQPYGGTSLMLADILDCSLAAGFMISGNGLADIATGKLRILGVCSAHRHSPWPDVPTMQESGVQGLNLSGWYGLMAHKDTDIRILTRLYKVLEEVKQLPEFVELMNTVALAPKSLSPSEIQNRIFNDIEECETLYTQYNLSRIG